MTKAPTRVLQMIRHIGPIMEERLAKEKACGPEADDTTVNSFTLTVLHKQLIIYTIIYNRTISLRGY